MVNCARRAFFWLKTPNVAKIQQKTCIFGIDIAFKMRIIVDVVSNSACYLICINWRSTMIRIIIKDREGRVPPFMLKSKNIQRALAFKINHFDSIVNSKFCAVPKQDVIFEMSEIMFTRNLLTNREC